MKLSVMIFLFMVGIVMAAALYPHEILLFILMTALSSGMLAIGKWKKTKQFLVGTFIGGTCENIGVYLGAWSYSTANYAFAPLWIPVAWGMALVLLEEAFSKDASVVFSKSAVVLIYGGVIVGGMASSNEILLLSIGALITSLLFLTGYYKYSELRMGITAVVVGTVVETFLIMEGCWQYNAAVLGIALWAPLCWFNGILLMRRIAMI